MVSSYDKEFAFEAFLNKLKEFGADILSITELKNKFITCEPYDKVRIYIKPKEKDNKDAQTEIRNRFEEIKKAERAKLKELQKVTAQKFYEAIYWDDIPATIKEEEFSENVETFEDLFT